MKLFVWDLHGVLEKGNIYSVQEVVNMVLPKFGVIRKATLQECLDLYGKKWFDYYRYFNPDADEEIINQMVERSVEIGLKEQPAKKHMKSMDYAHDVLEEIAKKGHVNIIISNSSQESLDYFLEIINMTNTFRYKYAADEKENIHEENSKEIWLKDFLQQHKFDKVIVIDDSIDGIKMGKRIGAITYHFRKDNKFYSKADNKISDLRKILKEI